MERNNIFDAENKLIKSSNVYVEGAAVYTKYYFDSYEKTVYAYGRTKDNFYGTVSRYFYNWTTQEYQKTGSGGATVSFAEAYSGTFIKSDILMSGEGRIDCIAWDENGNIAIGSYSTDGTARSAKGVNVFTGETFSMMSFYPRISPEGSASNDVLAAGPGGDTERLKRGG